MRARTCNHCAGVAFGDACDPCRERIRAERQHDEVVARAVGLADVEAAEERQQRRLAAAAYARQALALLRKAADLVPPPHESVVDAAGRAAEKAALDLEWYADRAASGLEILRQQVEAA